MSRKALMRKWNVTEEDVKLQPIIGGVLKRANFSREQVIDYLRGSPEKDAKHFLEVWDKAIKADRENVALEVFATCALINAARLFEIIAREVFEQTKYESTLLAAAAHPAVVRRTIESALEEPIITTDLNGVQRAIQRPAGVQDRKMLHQQAGFLPLPKTQFVSLPGVKSIDARQQSVSVTVLPSVESSVKRMADRFGDKLLPAAMDVPTEEIEMDDGEAEDDNEN